MIFIDVIYFLAGKKENFENFENVTKYGRCDLKLSKNKSKMLSFLYKVNLSLVILFYHILITCMILITIQYTNNIYQKNYTVSN